ncbi:MULTISPECIES: PIN domain-containing protein [Spirulina sp. CCY15215]|uniref:PIN domain-containing protein n=1 Tax=Spirulina sp. CCY15215 TaxID=2767591 RepID=UPI001950C0E8|nr:PIN domain-containing protein [Spirulina major]
MIRLVVDTNILVSELLRKRGRSLISSVHLELHIAEQVKNEAEYELKKRMAKIIDRGNLSQATGEEELAAALHLINTQIR